VLFRSIRPLASSQKITTKSGRNKEEILPPGQTQQVPKRATMRNQIIGITSSVLMMAICVTSFAPVPLRLDKLLARRGLFAEPGSEEDKFDMEELNQRIEDASNQYEKLFLTKEWERRPKPADVHIVLFKPDTDDEGVHTIEYPKGSGRNVILAFESAKECATFVSILKLQRFFDPSPRTMDLKNLEAYCKEIGVLVQVVPRGMALLPPSETVEQLGHNPNLGDEKKQLDCLFEMSTSHVEETGIFPGTNNELGGTWE